MRVFAAALTVVGLGLFAPCVQAADCSGSSDSCFHASATATVFPPSETDFDEQTEPTGPVGALAFKTVPLSGCARESSAAAYSHEGGISAAAFGAVEGTCATDSALSQTVAQYVTTVTITTTAVPPPAVVNTCLHHSVAGAFSPEPGDDAAGDYGVIANVDVTLENGGSIVLQDSGVESFTSAGVTAETGIFEEFETDGDGDSRCSIFVDLPVDTPLVLRLNLRVDVTITAQGSPARSVASGSLTVKPASKTNVVLELPAEFTVASSDGAIADNLWLGAPDAIDPDHDGLPDDGDGSGDAGDAPCEGPDRVGCDDNCSGTANAGQADVDSDGRGDRCDDCPTDPDPDGDEICSQDLVLVDSGAPPATYLVGPAISAGTVVAGAGTPMRYLANETDPVLGLSWTGPDFDDLQWAAGVFGIGFDLTGEANDLIQTVVSPSVRSVYVRADFDVSDVSLVQNLVLESDYDDAFAVWINGQEVFRSRETRFEETPWDLNPGARESSNGALPEFDAAVDISETGIAALVNGTNLLAIGIWNQSVPPSNDLVFVPRLSIDRDVQVNMRYRSNQSFPGLGLSWITEAFDDSLWAEGSYGVGFDTSSDAESLIVTQVPAGTSSIYTRTSLTIDEVAEVQNVFIGADYDDAYLVWINGQEVYRSPEMPDGPPAWNAPVLDHESSNADAPVFAPEIDITQAALPVLRTGPNLLAVGVWNETPTSSDLVLVPRLSVNRGPATPVRYLANAFHPGIGNTWTGEVFDDSAWTMGSYGVGYDDDSDALHFIESPTDSDLASIFTRAQFEVTDPTAIDRLALGVDYDDAVIAWINGVEVYRAPEMPEGVPLWNTPVEEHESSNAPAAVFHPFRRVGSPGIQALQAGTNVLAVGVWNASPESSDLVVAPRLVANGSGGDVCPDEFDPGQDDADGDGVGDVCDNCPTGFNPDQGPAPFPESMVAVDRATFSWSEPQDIEWVKGDLSEVSGYVAIAQPPQSAATRVQFEQTPPAAGAGIYVLVRLGGSCQSATWQTAAGAEPDRDLVLP